MPNTKSAKKTVRQTATRRSRNLWRLRTMREAIKDFDEQIMHGSVDKASDSFKKCQLVIDRNAQKGVIHQNQASRRKSRLSAKLKAKKAVAK
jgi:small subunit ribosomal protein S20